MIYNYLPGQKSDYNKGAQTAVAFTGGYGAGILCAIVSHPADVMVSKLNANRQPGEAFGAAMGRIYKDIGFKGLWNGLPVRIVMIGTLVRPPSPIVVRKMNRRLTKSISTPIDWSPMDDVCFPPSLSYYFPKKRCMLTTMNLQLRLVQDFHGTPNYRWTCSIQKVLVDRCRETVSSEWKLLFRVEKKKFSYAHFSLSDIWLHPFLCCFAVIVPSHSFFNDNFAMNTHSARLTRNPFQ